MAEPDVLARALASFVHGGSIWHSTEHHVYSQIPVNHTPHRLRVSPPTGDDPPTSSRQRMSDTDLFRQEMARQMFYETHTIRSLLDADYRFDDPALKLAVQWFHDALEACDQDQPVRFLAVERMACSVQF